jgi:hypothetical protein
VQQAAGAAAVPQAFTVEKGMNTRAMDQHAGKVSSSFSAETIKLILMLPLLCSKSQLFR